jgi:Tol biopolymer transport system component
MNFTLAPDDSRTAVQAQGIWTTDLRRNVSSLLVPQGSDPLWSPDGSRVAFSVAAEGAVFSIPAGGGERQLLFRSTGERRVYAEDWHPDGQHLALLLLGGGTEQGVIVSTTGGQTAVLFDETRDLEEPHFSPDGKWVAYNADRDGGGMEVYVVPNPPTGERVQVSNAGGGQARWRADGHELFYLTPTGTLMAVDVKTEGGLALGIPRQLFKTGLDVSLSIDQYAVSRDGQRFILPVRAERDIQPPRFVIVQNWFEELKRLVPTN